MPDAPICPIMSKVVHCSELDVERQVHFKLFDQTCIGSECAAWIAQTEHNKRGDLEPTGIGRCGMTLHATFNFPDPAKQPPDFPPNREIKDGDA